MIASDLKTAETGALLEAQDLSEFSLMDLFRTEAENQTAILTSGLLSLERDSTAADQLEACMRAAHSLKGAARIINLNAAVHVAHAMEDAFVAAQNGTLVLRQDQIDLLLHGVDLLTCISGTPEGSVLTWETEQKGRIDEFLALLSVALEGKAAESNGQPSPSSLEAAASQTKCAFQAEPDASLPPETGTAIETAREQSRSGSPSSPPVPTYDSPGKSSPADLLSNGNDFPVHAAPIPLGPSPAVMPGLSAPPSTAVQGRSKRIEPEARTAPAPAKEFSDRVLRVTADNLNRLLGLAGESLVESRWLNPFAASLLRLKRQQGELARTLDALRESLSGHALDERTQRRLLEAQGKVMECRQFLAVRLAELEMHDRHSTNLSHRLYEEALACRMRPFADGTQGFPRMVRDVARSLGKQVRFEIIGDTTQIDRDVLEKLEAPLTHLLRNAVDHGIESPEERRRAGKPEEGHLRLEARHSAGMLQIIVSDDGKGIDLEKLRQAVVKKQLTNAETAAKLSEAELLEFLFLPGFSTKEQVSEISGRGVGLDVVQNMVKQVRGSVRASSQLGQGTRFQLQLPLTLSVLRALLVEIAGEPYAFPLAYITRTLQLPKDKIESLEGRQHFPFDGRSIGLVCAHQILGRAEAKSVGRELPIVVIGDKANCYGIVVDRFIGERELVVQPLDPRLGKIKDISAGALMEDGAPLLVVDVDDLIRSIEKTVSTGPLDKVQREAGPVKRRKRKRVLIVDDSLTVRELERKLLGGRGYELEVAVDGMDGWNAVRTGHFDLVITDVDMPRMDGIELVSLIKKDANLRSLPVMIVSYKDREEDRRRGLEAGADYYMTKGSFHDESLINAVVDLIGEATA